MKNLTTPLYSQAERTSCNHKELGSHSLSSSSSLSPKGLQRVPCLPHCRNHAELLHQTEVVSVDPAFHKLPIGNPVDDDPGHTYLLASWWNAHQVALVRATIRITNRNRVALGNHVLNQDMAIRPGVSKHHKELLHAVGPGQRS